MLWILKMLIEAPKAIIIYRRDYYNHKKIRKHIRNNGVVEGFYLHDEIYGADIHEWLAICEYITERDEEIPTRLIDMALERGWITHKPEYMETSDDDTVGGTEADWREWENA